MEGRDLANITPHYVQYMYNVYMCHVHTCERSVLWLAVGAVVAVYVSCLVLLHTNTAADRGGGGCGWGGGKSEKAVLGDGPRKRD